MSIKERKGFHHLELDEKVTLAGQLLLTCGTAFLSLGQIFKLLKCNELPTTPINSPIIEKSTIETNLYRGRRSYFEN